MPINSARAFYDEAVIDYPANYTSYTFDQWMEFMVAYKLLIRHPSEMLEITVRGRDFLTYSAHNSLIPDERTG